MANRLLWRALCIAVSLYCLASARAETFPSRQVQLIVAYPAGGAADLIARGVAQNLSEM
jgi:tripartite-type tricarboxylate transporter receptor subunit TctC